MRRSIRILVGIGVSLGWQPVHLLVNLLAIYIDLGKLLLAAGLVSCLLEKLSLASKSLLKLGGLWVETIVVFPLVL